MTAPQPWMVYNLDEAFSIPLFASYSNHHNNETTIFGLFAPPLRNVRHDTLSLVGTTTCGYLPIFL